MATGQDRTIDRGGTDSLTGVIQSDFGDIEAQGKRIQSPPVGDWPPDISSERRNYAQRLRIHPDMSGLFGTLAIEKVRLERDTAKFKVTLEFGGQEFDMEFEGKLAESQLTGGFETSRGVQEVTGTKMVVGS